MIDWTDATAHVSPNFTVHEATWLPSWGQRYNPTTEEQANLTRTCELLERVRALLGPVRVHCMIRPAAYNAVIGGAANSAHIEGLAADFDIPGTACDDVRAVLVDKLEEWGCRMENRPGSTWVHLDLRVPPPGGHRFFLP